MPSFSLQKKFFLAFFSIAVLLVLLTTGVMHHQVREGFDEYVTNAKIQRLGKVQSVLVHMYQQDGSLDVLRKSGAWADLLASVEAVRRDQIDAELQPKQSRWDSSPIQPKSTEPVRNPETVAREDKAIASSVSIMLQSRQNQVVADIADSIPPYARGVALLDANGFFLAGETVDAQYAMFEPIRNAQRQIIAYWLVSRNGLAYDALGRTFMDEQFSGFLLMVAVAAVFSAFIAWMLSMHFRRPIAKLQTGFRAVAAGHLNTRLDNTDGNEMGDIATHFNRMTAQLEAQETARRQWVADTSHELRTPLTVLRMRTEAMRDGIVPNTDEEWQRSIKTIEDMSLLINDLQQMAKATAGQWDLNRQMIDLNQWLAEVVEDHKPAFEQAGLNLSYTPLSQSVYIQADEQRLQQVVRNILVNSMRYTDAPGQTQIRLETVDGWARVSIKDSSPGVPEASLLHLFERFYRVDGSRNRATGGSGLGLAISQGIVNAHGGTITAQHSDLGGLQIVIQLPLPAETLVAESRVKKFKRGLNLGKQ